MDLRTLPALQSPAAWAAARSGAATAAASRWAPAGSSAATGGVQASFQSALKAVSASQDEAGRLQKAIMTGEPGASLEQTMLAMQKAQIGFQSALHVRNRMVQAYTDIMNMQV